MSTDQSNLVKTAQILAYSGLLPFAASLIALFLIEDQSLFTFIVDSVVYYAGVIIVFISAVHWGYLITNNTVPNHSKRLVICIIPSLLVWIWLMLPSQISLACLFFAFIIWQKYEEASQDSLQFPDWYTLLRKHLSYTVAALLLLIWLVCFNA